MKKIFLIILFMFSSTSSYPLEHADSVINNAKVVDGSGKAAYQADIYLKNGIIALIDTSLSKNINSDSVIDANGRVVAPGFIDLHSHGNPLTHGDFTNYLAMGVTTISLGQDGFSPKVDDLAVWQQQVLNKGIGTNIAMFIGHGTLRQLAGVGNRSEITALELDTMKNILEVNMPHVFGMSTGLEYAPALFARTEELEALAQIIGHHNGLVMSHMRSEDDDVVIDSINELIQQGRYAKVHISHLKSVYGKGAARGKSILDVLKNARRNGIMITADIYPYIASYTGIDIVFPSWAKTRKQFDEVKFTRRKELAEFIRNKVNDRNGPEATLFGTAPYNGKTLKQVANDNNMAFEDLLIDEIGPEGFSAAYFVMDKDLQTAMIVDPVTAIASDGSPTSYHPRGHGTFAKLIEHFVVKEKLLSIEQAVHKVTGKAAKILGLKERGFIKQGMVADIVIFDPMKIKAVANYGSPHQLAEGFDYVMLGGQMALSKGHLNPARLGRMLGTGQ